MLATRSAKQLFRIECQTNQRRDRQSRGVWTVVRTNGGVDGQRYGWIEVRRNGSTKGEGRVEKERERDVNTEKEGDAGSENNEKSDGET